MISFSPRLSSICSASAYVIALHCWSGALLLKAASIAGVRPATTVIHCSSQHQEAQEARAARLGISLTVPALLEAAHVLGWIPTALLSLIIRALFLPRLLNVA